MRAPGLLWLILVPLALAACAGPQATPPTVAPPTAPPQPTAAPPPTLAPPGPFTLSSAAFTDGGAIAVEYSCDGENRSPALSWSAPPPGTQSLALIMEDPDASNYTHWVLFNIPPESRALAPSIPDGEVLSGIGMHAQNGFATPGYGGPCPDPGDTHEYLFTLYALDRVIPLDPAPTSPVSKGMLRDEMEGHILAEARLTGSYTRKDAP
jgi:Raf kinase inhibitor-like YbhB/YbcL family protein